MHFIKIYYLGNIFEECLRSSKISHNLFETKHVDCVRTIFHFVLCEYVNPSFILDDNLQKLRQKMEEEKKKQEDLEK